MQNNNHLTAQSPPSTISLLFTIVAIIVGFSRIYKIAEMTNKPEANLTSSDIFSAFWCGAMLVGCCFILVREARKALSGEGQNRLGRAFELTERVQNEREQKILREELCRLNMELRSQTLAEFPTDPDPRIAEKLSVLPNSNAVLRL
jgi:hypothetical protein